MRKPQPSPSPTTGSVPPVPPTNQRVVFLEALGLTLRERYPEMRCEVTRFSAGLPPVLRVTWRSVVQEVGCDLSCQDGWRFVWGFDPRSLIGPAAYPVQAARAVADVLGVQTHPDY